MNDDMNTQCEVLGARAQSKRWRRGVTLMEALATLSLSVVLITPVITTLSSTRKTWEGFANEANQQLTARAALDSICRELGDAASVVTVRSGANASLSARVGVALATWTLLNGELSYSADETDEPTSAVRLASGVAGLEFSLLDRAGSVVTTPGEAAAVWVEIHVGDDESDDSSTAVLKRLVRLRALPVSTDTDNGNGNGKGNGKGRWRDRDWRDRDWRDNWRDRDWRDRDWRDDWRDRDWRDDWRDRDWNDRDWRDRDWNDRDWRDRDRNDRDWNDRWNGGGRWR